MIQNQLCIEVNRMKRRGQKKNGSWESKVGRGVTGKEEGCSKGGAREEETGEHGKGRPCYWQAVTFRQKLKVVAVQIFNSGFKHMDKADSCRSKCVCLHRL